MTKVGANWVVIGALRVFKGSMNAVQFVVFVRKRCKGYSFMTKVSCGLPFQGLVSDPCTSDPSSSSLVVSPVSYILMAGDCSSERYAGSAVRVRSRLAVARPDVIPL